MKLAKKATITIADKFIYEGDIDPKTNEPHGFGVIRCKTIHLLSLDILYKENEKAMVFLVRRKVFTKASSKMIYLMAMANTLRKMTHIKETLAKAQ